MGRGTSKASGGKSKTPYGTEFRTLLQDGKVKFVVPTSGATAAPMYTQTPGRVYATIDKNNKVKYITFYDDNLKRYKQIDLRGQPHKIDDKMELPHVHYGYLHDENGTFKPNKEEQRMIDRILKKWYNHINGKK